MLQALDLEKVFHEFLPVLAIVDWLAFDLFYHLHGIHVIFVVRSNQILVREHLRHLPIPNAHYVSAHKLGLLLIKKCWIGKASRDNRTE